MLTPLQEILTHYRTASQSARELGTYFEELIRTYLRHEPVYADLYSDVWLLSEVPAEHGISKTDTGIDLVARTRGTGEFHAIQCKFYAEDHVIQKGDIDSFFTASGQKPFSHRLIVVTSNNWSANAEASLFDQQPPVSRIELGDLESSLIDWSTFKPNAEPDFKPRFAPRQHQKTAIKNVVAGLKKEDRGKLIMACGTGKTFTSLQIAEELAGKGKQVLFLVPSLALLSQTLTEWTHQSGTPLHSFAVCSDVQVGKKRLKDDDIVQTFVHELRFPATTDAKRLAEEVSKRHDATHMTVVFSTYQSIEVISKAQSEYGLGKFDLIICDEAHRTTGATFESELESAFVRVHDSNFIRGSKRLYMTATPRIYADIAKAKAIQQSIELCSMDDEALYGKQLHVITFSEAVELGLLTDYKVVVLTIDEDHVSERLQNLLKDDNNQLKVDDAARIIGCWKALSKQGLAADLQGDTSSMQKAVAFCQVIEPTTGKKTHKVSSKQIAEMFQEVVDAYQEANTDDLSPQLLCESEHVDGSMNAAQKEELINWLKSESKPNTCRILSNVRCLSEGVDVPALDAVLFLSPRNSQVEVVQSVGRVMRKAPGKNLGYVILPVVIPHGMTPHEALSDNKIYKVVWEVLQALRSHDDRFDSLINKLDLIEDSSGKMEVIAITDTLSPKPKSKADKNSGKGEHSLASSAEGPAEVQRKLQFDVGELEKALYAKLVKKCGSRTYWEDWAGDIAKIAQTHISRITAIVNNPKNSEEITAFEAFANELRDDLNDSITNAEVIEMLAQHLITKPVFDALFADYSFASNNPVSQGMQNILDLLNEHRLEKEADTLEKFYASVRRRAEGINKAEGKQKIVVELYDKFFRKAFPKMTERLGIVYTPVEVVDFIIHSVNDILQAEFGQTLGSEGVHILDPFVGTGTFITRLMQSGLISPEQLPHKYKHEIHCNEIVLLAYYIAAINIEAVYHGIVGGKYTPFDGICLTDTFQMYESDDLIEQFFPDNSERRKRQKKLDIRVILGNPPYSVGQDDAEDDNQNVIYPFLDERIRSTYGPANGATLQRNMFDSYVRALRWASDRLHTEGIIGVVTNSSFLTRGSLSGIRRSLANEFSKIYVFDLRGDQRGDWRTEGGKIFGDGSQAGISITILVKTKARSGDCDIFYRRVSDAATRDEKLADISALGSVSRTDDWYQIVPDPFNDWLSQRDASLVEDMLLGSKNNVEAIFSDQYTLGVSTNRDPWCYNFSRQTMADNIATLTAFYTEEVKRLCSKGLTGKEAKDDLRSAPNKIKWSRKLKGRAASHHPLHFTEESIRQSLYRPFAKQWLYLSDELNESPGQNSRFFPTPTSENLLICCTAAGNRVGFSVLICDQIPDLHMVDASGGNQCFPMYKYHVEDGSGLFQGGLEKGDAISEAAIEQFRRNYSADGDVTIARESLFYYIYGLLHSPEYRERYKDNLSKELPRIPAVKKHKDFVAFSQAGRDLAYWHLNFETVDCYPVTLEFTAGKKGPQSLKACREEHFYVRKMRFPKTTNPETGKRVNDRTKIIYNEFITAADIPLEAYDYVVNGKSAIEWVMERQAVTTDNKSGIINDANLWATETMDNAAYPLELLRRVITVSLETMKIVNNLPKLEID